MSEFTEDKLFRDVITHRMDSTALEAAYTYGEWHNARFKNPEELMRRGTALMAQQAFVEASALAFDKINLSEKVADDQTVAEIQQKYESYLLAFGTHKEVDTYEKLLDVRPRLIVGEPVLVEGNDHTPKLGYIIDGTPVLAGSGYTSHDNLEYRHDIWWNVPVEGADDGVYWVDAKTPVGHGSITTHLSKSEEKISDLSVEEVTSHSNIYKQLGLPSEATDLEKCVAELAFWEIKQNNDSHYGFEKLIRRVERFDANTFQQLKNCFAHNLVELGFTEYDRLSIRIMQFYTTIATIELEKEGNDSDELSPRQVFERAAPLILEAYDQGAVIVEELRQQKEAASGPIAVDFR